MARTPQGESATTRVLRTIGIAVVGATTFYLAMQTVALLSGDLVESPGRRYALAAAFALAAVATGSMTVDLVDRWLRGGRMTPFSQRMIRSLVFVTLLVALLLSVGFRGPAFFLPLLPALVIYLVATWQRPGARQPVRRTGGAGAGKSRQRRGGKRRR